MSFFRYLINLFKKGKPTTALHKEYKSLIEPVKSFDGRMLYKFKSLLDMPHMRYNNCNRFAEEFNLRLEIDELQKSLETIQDLAFSDQKPDIKLKKINTIIDGLLIQTKMSISIDASYRLASCVYFWEDESLEDYDFEIGDAKIELFKKEGFENFFLKKPMNQFLPQMNLSLQDLEVFSRIEKERKKLMQSILKETKEEKELMT